MIKKYIKKLVPGVSWQNPILNTGFIIINPFDWIIRKVRGYERFPKYSIRIRSTGVYNQFGGEEFEKVGLDIRNLLVEQAQLQKNSNVLEIGCGCGRTAFALTEYLEDGSYIGMDIEKYAVKSCLENRYLNKSDFSFDHMDVQNDEFNPNGKFSGSQFEFPYNDGSFDIIFLTSVFTHMMTDDVSNYISEISRLLKPSGKVLLTTFLVERNSVLQKREFPYLEKSSYYKQENVPEIAVAYELQYFDIQFEIGELARNKHPLIGAWNTDIERENRSGIFQDVLVYQK